MKKLSMLIALAVIFSSCSKILYQPAASKVKRVAIVSLYMNRQLYQDGTERSQEGSSGIGSLLQALGKKALAGKIETEETYTDELHQIVTYGLVTYYKQLSAIGIWTLLPPEEVVANTDYKALVNNGHEGTLIGTFLTAIRENAEKDWITAPGYNLIPISSVVEEGTHYYGGNAKNPTAEGRKAMAELCKKLKVDAVALIQIDASYRFGKLAKLTVGNVTMVKPLVVASMVMVNSDGDIAVNTGFQKRSTGEKYEGPSVGMVVGKQVVLRQRDNKPVEAYNAATEKSAVAMRDSLVKAFQKP